MKPYIGITDFMSPQQVARMLAVFEGANTDRVLHVGVMMSRKTLLGMETKWVDAFPPKEEIPGIFAYPDAYNCLHYVDYRQGKRTGFAADLVDALCYGGAMDAVQLDVPWPDPPALVDALTAYSMLSMQPLEVILQVGGRALDEANNDPQEVVERLQGYKGHISRVLLDRSMGRGVGMDAQALLPFARAIQEGLPEVGLVAAGGLGPHTLDLVKPLLEEFPNISIDAQGQLRSSGSALDPIEWDRAEAYLRGAIALFTKD